jgi:predicted amidohydrolase
MGSAPFTVAAIEFNPGDDSLEANVAGAAAMAREAAAAGAKLIVLPEDSTSGFDFNHPGAPQPFFDIIPGAMTAALEEVTAEFGCYVAVGIYEFEPRTGLRYNSAALVGPEGLVGRYRKNGLNDFDQLWFSPGNTGHPVWHTEYGRVCMIICYDDTYWEPARLSALKGADVILYPCNAGKGLSAPGEVMPGGHFTISATQEMCAWNGLALVASDQANVHMAPSGKLGIYSAGAAAIWSPTGEKLAAAPVVPASASPGQPGAIIYAEIDPAAFDNEQKRTMAWRRPELYGDLTLFRAPLDLRASTESHPVRAAAVQVEQVAGDRARCTEAVDEAVAPLEGDVDLVVLPAFTLTGPPADTADAAELAEPADGATQAIVAEIAGRLGAHVVASHIERDGTDLFHRAMLMAPDGTLVGAYRQAHIDPERSAWATGGDDFPCSPPPSAGSACCSARTPASRRPRA